jgi:hypothetical protein
MDPYGEGGREFAKAVTMGLHRNGCTITKAERVSEGRGEW